MAYVPFVIVRLYVIYPRETYKINLKFWTDVEHAKLRIKGEDELNWVRTYVPFLIVCLSVWVSISLVKFTQTTWNFAHTYKMQN